MTRTDHRAQCIETMRAAYRTELNADGRAEEMRGGLRAMTAAFDSLHGVAVVYARDDDCYIYCHGGRMLIGDADLTNPQETKP